MSGQVVYIAESNLGFHKIGISKHPLRRAEQLSVPGILDMQIIHTIPILFARKIEKLLHDTLQEYRVSPEWFKLPPELIDAVRECEGEYDLLQFCGLIGE